MTAIYGIPNCDKCRKAIRWFDRHKVSYEFHDVRKDGLDNSMIKNWLKKVTADELLNRRSTTWRGLTEAERTVSGTADAAALLVQHPTLLKRPLVESKGAVTVGYDEQVWKELYL